MLTPRTIARRGTLCRENQFERKSKSRFAGMFDDDDEEEEVPLDLFKRSDDYGGGLED